MSKPNVFLALPSHGNEVHWGSAFAFARPGLCQVSHYPCQTSLLTHNFNIAWCACLNERRERGFTHFAMIHADIIPQPVGTPWLDDLLEIQNRVGADVLSAVVPIKNACGLTSTAMETSDPWSVRRLTMREIFNRPATFTDPNILANTGLWVCRLGDWCEKVCFRQQDRIMRGDDGKFYPATIPEDWEFSRQVRALGRSVWVTREVAVRHQFDHFTTQQPWGEWDTDQHVTPAAEPVESVAS